MKIYIAGPMTGYPDHNFPAFHRAAAELRAKGHEAISPAELDDPNLSHEELAQVPWAYYLRRDLKVLLDCDAIVVLHGWHASRGANLERFVALRLDMPVYYGTVEVPEADGIAA